MRLLGGGAQSPPSIGFVVLIVRSEEHTSELQSRQYLVCRLLLEKKKKPIRHPTRAALAQPPTRPQGSSRWVTIHTPSRPRIMVTGAKPNQHRPVVHHDTKPAISR